MNFKPTPFDATDGNLRYRVCDEENCLKAATVILMKPVGNFPMILNVERQLCGKHARRD